ERKESRRAVPDARAPVARDGELERQTLDRAEEERCCRWDIGCGWEIRPSNRVLEKRRNLAFVSLMQNPTNRPIMPCTSVPPSTPTNMTGIGVLRPLATSGRNMLSSKFTGTM